jgi:excisionase family DNA binding protein
MNKKTTKAALAAAAEALAGAAQAFDALAHLTGADRGESQRVPAGDDLLSAPEAAEVLGMSKSWVYRKIEDGELTHVRLGAKIRVRRSDLDAFIAERILGD